MCLKELDLRYNLGCGFTKKKGYINVDKSKEVNPDILADIEIMPWTWAESNNAELIEMDNLIEHIERKNFVGVMKECHRVLKKDGILWIRVPEMRVDNLMAALSDPDHFNWYTVETTDYFDCHNKRWKNFGRAYGIPPFERVEQHREGRFLIIRLSAVK